jgi:Cu-Zn family superoxide dismutase
VAVAPAAAADDGGHGRNRLPDVYTLPGEDPVDADGGSKYEGIGLDRLRGLFYVSETTGGEISRGKVTDRTAKPWLDGNGKDGRTTARGVTVDRLGRVYIAGGPNGMNTGAPDLWVYASSGRLLAAFNIPAADAFLNDVTIGPDGAAYFTDSSTNPRIFRVAQDRPGWSVRTWVDATGELPATGAFNLNGIVTTPDGRALRALIAVQSTSGTLWRFDLQTRAFEQITVTGPAQLTGGDGLVLVGKTLYVVRNTPRQVVTLSLGNRWTTASLVSVTDTDPERVFTTAKYDRGRLLAVDSKFDEALSKPPYQVVAIPVR